MSIRSTILIHSLVCLITGCGRHTVTERELQSYIANEGHGLKKEREIGDVKLTVSYKPNDLIILQDVQGKGKYTMQDLEQARKDFGGYDYFVINISRSGKEVLMTTSGRQELNAEMNELMFNMGEHIFLVNEHSDTIPFVDYIYPRMYGLAASTDLLFVFKKDTAADDRELTLNIEDFGLGIGTNKFTFDKRDILAIPPLDFKNTLN